MIKLSDLCVIASGSNIAAKILIFDDAEVVFLKTENRRYTFIA